MHSSPTRLLYFSVALVGVVAQGLMAQQQICSRELEMRAINEVSSVRLKNWNAVYRSFKTFQNCDDGGIAEVYSDAIGTLLDDGWKEFDEAYRLTLADGSFQQFVLRHIDTTLLDDQLQAIAENARARCPAGKSPFCNLIEASAVDALKEQSLMVPPQKH
jgi:hypothetical protein